MYKGASEKLVWRTAVDRPHPSRGYIDGGPDPMDVLPDVSALGRDALRAEQRQLRQELIQAQQQLARAKADRSKAAITGLGLRLSALASRLSAVNKALFNIDGPSELRLLGMAVRELAGDELAEQIFARAKELRASDRDGTPRRREAAEGEACQPGPPEEAASPILLAANPSNNPPKSNTETAA